MHDSHTGHAPSAVPRKRSPTVLIVEHHSWLRSMLVDLFQDMGYAVASASNGIAGLRFATAHRPNVVVLGNPLSELSTAQLAAELQALRGAAEMRLILAGDLLNAALPRPPEMRVAARLKYPEAAERWHPSTGCRCVAAHLWPSSAVQKRAQQRHLRFLLVSNNRSRLRRDA